jgi:hypothetical protein
MKLHVGLIMLFGRTTIRERKKCVIVIFLGRSCYAGDITM